MVGALLYTKVKTALVSMVKMAKTCFAFVKKTFFDHRPCKFFNSMISTMSSHTETFIDEVLLRILKSEPFEDHKFYFLYQFSKKLFFKITKYIVGSLTTKCCEIQSLVNHDNVIKCLEMRRRRHHWISLFNLALNLQQDT